MNTLIFHWVDDVSGFRRYALLVRPWECYLHAITISKWERVFRQGKLLPNNLVLDAISGLCSQGNPVSLRSGRQWYVLLHGEPIAIALGHYRVIRRVWNRVECTSLTENCRGVVA